MITTSHRKRRLCTARSALMPLAAGALVVSALAAPATHAATSAQHGRVAFVSYRDANHEIYALDPDSAGHATRVTREVTATDSDPSLSPDGTKVVFSSDRSQPGAGKAFEIYMMNADGTGPATRLTENATSDTDPAFSSDGTQIAFVRGGDIYTMHLPDRGVTQLTSNSASEASPVFSPDGQRIAFSRLSYDKTATGNVDIYTVDVRDPSAVRRLTDDPAADEDPAFSPDGKALAFTSNRGEGGTLYTMDADGSDEVLIPSSELGDRDPSYSPDGSQIAFSRGYPEDVFAMNADGTGTARRLTTSAQRDYAPSWGGAPPACTPGRDEVAVYEGANYQGRCVVKGIGRYDTATAFAPLPDDSASSIRVGDNVEAVLASGTVLGGDRERFSAADADFSDNGPIPGEELIGDNRMSSFKVQVRGSHGWTVTLDLHREQRWVGEDSFVAAATLAKPRFGGWQGVSGRELSFAFGATPETDPRSPRCVLQGCTTNGAGVVTWTYDATDPGTDHIIAYYDQDANGVPDTGEPRTTATVTWIAADYVALGDSFSSGEGVPAFIPGTEDTCHRSQYAPPESGAYSGYLYEGLGSGSFGFWACSGARTEHVLRTRQWPNEPPQAETLAAIDEQRGVDFVTISIGGNDIGFEEVLTACWWAGDTLCQDDHATDDSGRTWNEVVRARIAALEAPGGPLDDVFAAIAKHVAPGARVLVLGYPRLFRANLLVPPRTRCQHRGTPFGLWEADMNWMNDMTAALNLAIERRVTAASFPGVEFQYVDQWDAFVDGSGVQHQLCAGRSADEEWLHGIVLTEIPFSFHPKARGQLAMAERVWSAIRD